MIRSNKTLSYLFLAFILPLGLYSCDSSEKVLYIDAAKAFDSFNLTQELMKKTEKSSSNFSAQLDSLELAIKTNGNTESEEYRRLVYRFQETENARNNELAKLVDDSDAKIWSLLNGYFMEFGETTTCDVLLGGTGNGNVLYIKPENNVTDKFIEFANRKYEGE